MMMVNDEVAGYKESKESTEREYLFIYCNYN